MEYLEKWKTLAKKEFNVAENCLFMLCLFRFALLNLYPKCFLMFDGYMCMQSIVYKTVEIGFVSKGEVV